MPISKHFSTGSPDPRPGRRRPRPELTREMISAPLGDFRHTMHVGRGGDAFGDTSFLRERPPDSPRRRRRGESPPPPPQPAAGRESLLARTLRASKRSLSVGRSARLSSTSTSSFVAVPVSSPVTSAATSAPSSPVASLLPLSQSEIEVQCVATPRGQWPGHSPPQPLLTPPIPAGPFTGVTAGFGPHAGRHNGAAGRPDPPSEPRDQAYAAPALKHAESVMSFHVDLGPSMLGDVLGVMGSEEAPGRVAAAPASPTTPARVRSGRGGSRSSSVGGSSGGSSATLADDAASQDGGDGAWSGAASEKRPAAMPVLPFAAALHHHHHLHHHPLGAYLDDDEILPF